jgi:Fe2+ or Zn2+ uptake regulation protein
VEYAVVEALLNLGGQQALSGLERHEVDPHQFLGLELNTRARHIAELVLWIGYLQWHIRNTRSLPGDPVLKDYKNIKNMDAVLAYDDVDAKGNYINPRRPEWPEADYIVGNPPFLGKGAIMRQALGDEYVEALWKAHPHINESADFVMYWWDRAADKLTSNPGRLKRFGLVTTNSVTQVFNRRVIENRISQGKISIVFAVPDHPWTKATKQSASVRIAMTVAQQGLNPGVRKDVVSERNLETDDPDIVFSSSDGFIHANLGVGANLAGSQSLRANDGMSCNGMMLAGRGFVLTQSQADHLVGLDPALKASVVKPYINGGELVRSWNRRYVIDLYGKGIDYVRDTHPHLYQYLLQAVKPEREKNRRPAFRTRWWVFGEPRRTFRPALEGLERYIATTETAKHRIFQFISSDLIPDHMIIAVASDDPFHLGVLSSGIHVKWAVNSGGWLGIGNDPRYSKSRCFDPFPFPNPDEFTRARIAGIAEKLDTHRKDVQADHPEITLTQMYNVLEKLKAGDTLSREEERLRDDGLVLILKEHHEELDHAVAQAYGWPVDLGEDDILARLVALNRERAAEEAKGHVRWLRPEYQIPRFGSAREKAEQLEADLGAAPVATPKSLPAFPSGAVEQTGAVMAALAAASSPLSAGDIARSFRKGRNVEPQVRATLAAMARMGFIVVHDSGTRFALRRAA